MEYTNGGYRFENIRSNAYWHNAKLDTRFKPTDISDAQSTIEHYNDCIKNPTRGLLARRKFETQNYPEYRMRNESIMRQFPEVRTLKDSFENKFNKELYPKTKNARKFLINNEFVLLDYVKPHVKTIRKALFKMIGI